MPEDRSPARRRPRSTPLVATSEPGVLEPGAPESGTSEPEASTPSALPGGLDAAPVTAGHGPVPSVLLAVGVAVGVGVAAVAIAFSVIAVPLYALASLEPGSGLDRDLVRRGLFGVAIPFGVLVGIVVGALVGVWYGRGGRLPGDRTPIHE